MPVRLDIHVHTYPGSRCSKMRVNSYLEAVIEQQLEAACLTNHGELRDFDHLARVAPAGLLLVPGVEISSGEGDFIVFSGDYEYLDSLTVMQPLPEREERPPRTAVVWVHPFAGMRPASFSEEYIAGVAPLVDGIEVFNGNWPDPEASRRAREVAARYALAELGGSDAHRRANLFRCWTELPGMAAPGDLVDAILARKTRAVSPLHEE